MPSRHLAPIRQPHFPAGPHGLVIAAPAKLNLFLEIRGKRPDGYHDLETLMVAVDLFDTLELHPDSHGAITLECDPPGLPTGPDNLVWKAADALRRAVNRPELGAAIRLTKRIPAQAGLAGGSSDAASTLLGLNRVWNLGLATADLAAVAAGVGSDVAFFLDLPAAWCTGRGEVVTPEPAPPVVFSGGSPPTPNPPPPGGRGPTLPSPLEGEGGGAAPPGEGNSSKGIPLTRASPGDACPLPQGARGENTSPPVGEVAAQPRVGGGGADSVFHFVLACPPVGLATADVYKALASGGCQPPVSGEATGGSHPPLAQNNPVAGDRVRAAFRAGDVAALGAALFNRLQGPAVGLAPAVGELYRRLSDLNPAGCLMSGSGSAVFALCRDRAEAARVAAALRASQPPGGSDSRVLVVRSLHIAPA